jgi:hypothetical protein
VGRLAQADDNQPTGPAQRFRRALALAGRHAWTLAFWLLLAGLTAFTIAPVWLGPYPPLMDFGGHLSLVDGFARLDESPLLASYLERTHGLAPNLLAARFVGLLYPLVPPLEGLRLWITGGLLLQVLGVLWYLSVTGRSRWQAFIAIPFMWSAPLVIGFVNFIPIVGLVFVGLALGRRAGEEGHWRWSLALGLLGLLSYFLHGIGYAFVVSLTCLMLVLNAARLRHLLHLLALLPSLLLWYLWLGAGLSDPTGGPPSGVDRQWEFFTPDQLVLFISGDVLNVAKADTDLGYLLGFLGIWLVWVGVGVGGVSAAESDAARPSLLRRGWRELRQHSDLIATLVLCAYVVFLPVFIRTVAIGYRVMQPAAMAVLLLPRLPRRSLVARVGLLAALLWAFSWAGFVNQTIQEYHATESPAFMEAVAQIPAGSRVACVNIGRATSALHFRTLLHNCYGVVQYYADSFAGSDFAASGFNALRYREGVSFPSLPDTGWERHRALRDFDYVLVRYDDGNVRSPNVLLAHHAPARGAGSAWSLYRVVSPTPR